MTKIGIPSDSFPNDMVNKVLPHVNEKWQYMTDVFNKTLINYIGSATDHYELADALKDNGCKHSIKDGKWIIKKDL